MGALALSSAVVLSSLSVTTLGHGYYGVGISGGGAVAETASSDRPARFDATLTLRVTTTWQSATFGPLDPAQCGRTEVRIAGRRDLELRSARATSIYLRLNRGRYLIRPFAVRHLVGSLVQEGTIKRVAGPPALCDAGSQTCGPERARLSLGLVRARHTTALVLDRLRYVADRDVSLCGRERLRALQWMQIWRAPGATHGDTLGTRYRVIEITGGGGFGAHADGANGFSDVMEEVSWKLTLRRR